MSQSPDNIRNLKLAQGLRLGLIALTLLYALIAGLRTVVDFDLGWQMAAGRYLVAHHAIPRTELFSYTAHGAEWIYPILSGVLFYLLYKIAGYAAISWLCALACTGTAAILLYRRSLWAVALVALAIPVLASETLPRASLFTMLLFAAFARVLLEHYEPGRHEDRRPPLWLLPVLMLLWVNLHTGFVAGLALIAVYLLVEALDALIPARRGASLQRVKQAAPWLLTTLFTTLLNPWGYRILIAVLRQESVVRAQSAALSEWAPAQLHSALYELGWRDPASAHWWLLAIGVILTIGCLLRRRIGPAVILVAAALAFLQHQRMEGPCIVLICLIGGSVLTHSASENRLPWRSPGFQILVTSLLTLLIAVRCFDLTTNRTYLASGDATLFGSGASWWLPEKATDFLLQNKLPTQVFSSFNLGSYLVWKLGETYPDFADGRYVPFGEPIFDQQRTLTALPLDSPQWVQAAQTDTINTVIFPLSRVFALGESPLLADCASKDWTPVYIDTAAVIFLRNASQSPATLERLATPCATADLLAHIPHPSAERYEALANASAIYALLGRFNDAQHAADLAQAIYSKDPTLYFVRAQAALGTQQYDQAEAELQTALRLKQTDAGWYNLGFLYLRERRLPEAIQALQRSAGLSTQDYERYLLIGNVQLLAQQPQDALSTLTEATRRSPYGELASPASAEFRARVAEAQAAAYRQLKQPEKAIERQRFALRQTPFNPSRKAALAKDCEAATQAPCEE